MAKRKSRIVFTPGEVLRELRLKKCWSQKTLSEVTDIAVTNLSNIENGRSRLGEDRALILATALEVEPNYLLFPNGFEREDLKERIKEVKARLKKLKKLKKLKSVA